MIDVRRLRTEPDAVRAALARRGVEGGEVDELLTLDEALRHATGERDHQRAEVKRLSRAVGAARKAAEVDKAEALAAESRSAGEAERAAAERASALEATRRDLLLHLPNLPSPDAPDGRTEADNVVLRVEAPGIDPFDPAAYAPHQRVPHWEIGAQLGLIDLERAAKLSGSMFPMYRGDGARLLRALTQLALDRHADAYEEIRPPTFVRAEAMVGTGALPKFAEDAYHLDQDDLWAIPTAEVPLTSLAADEVLAEADLPLRLTAYTPCFRREAGSAGRDTRGLLRSHEFDKVELFAYATPDQAAAVHADILARAEDLLRTLGLAYRVVDLCTGDLGFSSARTFDLEAYSPGVGTWLEVSSVSWFSDFQARRANVRYRPEAGGAPAFVHTLNGSALAWPRVWAALVETHRQADGTIALPDVLQPYLRGQDVIGPRR